MVEFDNSDIPLSRLKEIALMVMHAAEATSLEQVLQRIAHATRELIGARYAALGVPDGQGGLRFFKVSGITEEEIALIPHPPVGLGLIGLIMHERQTVRLPRMQDHPKAVGFPEGHPPMTSMLGVPIQSGSQLFGMLYLTDREDDQPFTLQDQWLVETMAGYAALAIAGSQLREQQHRLTLLEERQRIGMELHDGVIQSLYAVGMHLDLMRKSGEVRPESLQQSIDGLNSVIEDIREYIMKLKSREYHAKTSRESIYEMIARLYIPDSLKVEVEAPDYPPPFSIDDFESICLMVGEAFSNAVRHADAEHLAIRCRQNQGHYQIVIKDDGRGFDPDRLKDNSGLGLQNIMRRAKLYGGEVEIESKPGSGTTLIINLPLTNSQ
jgi:signal transduction histidine kinase